MSRLLLVFFAFVLSFFVLPDLLLGQTVEEQFLAPPEETKPGVYWYWLNNNVSKEGITTDLEALKKAGIGTAMIGHIQNPGTPEGNVPALGPEWWDAVTHAVKEGNRIGVNVGMFNSPGWSQSGGPWVKPEQSMRYLVAKTSLNVGETIDADWVERQGRHDKAIQDVVTIAFPIPKHYGEFFRPAQIITEPKHEALEKVLMSQDREFGIKVDKPVSVEFVSENLQLVQTFSIRFKSAVARASGIIEAAGNETAAFEKIGEFKIDNHGNVMPAMGPLNREPYVFGVTPTAAKRLRIVFQNVDRGTELESLDLTAAALVDRGAEKQLGRMWGTPVPPPDGYLWEPAPENLLESSVAPTKVVNLTKHFKTNKTWNVPENSGETWVVMRIGMASTGVENGPAPPQATGLEVDKMSRKHIAAHFDGMIGEFLKRVPEDQRQNFKRVVVDSYEVGPQNWTDDFETIFAERYGYDPVPWLPCIENMVVGSREQTDRFLWDWRRLVADLISEKYVGGLREASNKHGLHLWCENYGHWGFPGESLQYGAFSDYVAGEYWQTNPELGPIECRLASSCAHIYGKNTVFAEAFTAGENFTHFPGDLKIRGDWCFTQGVNQFILHLMVHQPYKAVPGIVPWFGLDFNRNSTWFADFGSEWTDYLRRCSVLLKQGVHMADVAYFFGEDTPRMNGQIDPLLPKGYDFDFVNADVILNRMTCKDGCWTLPDGKQYRILAIPGQIDKMSPELIAKLESLVKDGCVLLGNPPTGSPSLKNYPQCDQIVAETAAKLWGVPEKRSEKFARKVGQGSVFCGMSLEEAFAELNLRPDVDNITTPLLWTHRFDAASNTDYYFVSNQTKSSVNIEPVFRVSGRRPELWNAVDASMVEAAMFSSVSGGTCVPLSLPPSGSVFVIFRKPTNALPGVVAFRKDGKDVFPLTLENETDSSFAIVADVLPTAEINLPQKASPRGAHNTGQNWLYFPTHGNRWGEGHSGAGLSVGTNGVVVSEHWHNNIPPVLVWKSEKPLGADGKAFRVALVYKKGTPVLYINGEKVTEGVPSGQKVHAPGDSRPQADFKGRVIKSLAFPKEMDEKFLASFFAVLQWDSVPLITHSPDVQLVRNDNSLILNNGKSGTYEAVFADGSKKTWNVSSGTALPFHGASWKVTLAQMGGETRTYDLPSLGDLSESDDEFVKYFSGTATYVRKFRITPDAEQIRLGRVSTDRQSASVSRRYLLCLGEVARICSVKIDGKDVGTLWTEPYMVDITDFVTPGKEHTLEIAVGTSWLNRMIGDDQLPDDVKDDPETKAGRWPKWFVEGEERPEKRRISFASHKPVGKDSALVPSGLIGPVEIHEMQTVVVP